MTQTTLTPKDYKSEVKPTWCPGCGDFGVLNAIYNSMASLKLPLDQTIVVSGIGCSSRLPHFVETFGFHSLHGRALPVAQGMKMARPDLTVIAVGGDGDFFSIGAGHLIHAALRNIDITVVVMDNETYGLTKGQTSPTSPTGHTTKSTPYRSEEHTSELQSQSNLVCRLLLEKKQPHHRGDRRSHLLLSGGRARAPRLPERACPTAEAGGRRKGDGGHHQGTHSAISHQLRLIL